MYVANSIGSNTVSVIDPATNTVVATIPVGSSPIGIAFNPDNGFMYVANLLATRLGDRPGNKHRYGHHTCGISPIGIAFNPDNGICT